MPKGGKQQHLSKKPQEKEVAKARNRKKNEGASSQTSKEKKLLVLDLDETLTHSRHVTFDDDPHDLSFAFSGYESTYFVKKRPDVNKFLERAAQLFNITVFTASDKDYADRILDFLDPEGKYISKRAYIDSGVYLPDGYAKDLTIFGVDLAKVVIIDNCPHNFRLQKNNGIPITSWSVDSQDAELLSLLPLLETLAEADDVRPIIADKYDKNEKKMENKKKGSSAQVLSLSAKTSKMHIN